MVPTLRLSFGSRYANLLGTTFTGAAQGIAPVNGADFVTLDYFNMHSGTGPVTSHDLIVGWSADTTITETEVLAGATSDTNTITIPNAGTGGQYLFIWRADADGGDPTEVHIAGRGNSRNTYWTCFARTVDSIPGQLICFGGAANVLGCLKAETLEGCVTMPLPSGTYPNPRANH